MTNTVDNAKKLEKVLSDFQIRGQVLSVRSGPVVTTYELEPAPGTKASKIVGLAHDVARYMGARAARITAIPGRPTIGIELPNETRQMVSMDELLNSDAFLQSDADLPIILGQDINGDPMVADLAAMPHLLVAGTTGSGKSVGINAMLVSLLTRFQPSDLRMIMIDPKMLELSVYDGIPHLLSPVVTDSRLAVDALRWVVDEMEFRYRQMARVGARNLSNYNQKVSTLEPKIRRIQVATSPTGAPIFEEEVSTFDAMPRIVVVVDEFADLMMTAGKEVEGLIQRIAQKARAAGIHLILATQRPSVDVVTGMIKANLPTRLSFQVASEIDSRTILGEQGAEQLLGKGDMLLMQAGRQLTRIHGPFVSDEAVETLTGVLRASGEPQYEDFSLL